MDNLGDAIAVLVMLFFSGAFCLIMGLAMIFDSWADWVQRSFGFLILLFAAVCLIAFGGLGYEVYVYMNS